VKRSIIAVLIVTQLIAGCGSTQETASTTTTTRPELPERPELAVDQMVAALMLNDVEALRYLTSDRQLAIIVALEGGGTAELAEMLELGVPTGVAENFWVSFVEGFPELVGESIENMEFRTSIPQRVGGIEFVSYPIAFGSAAAGTEWFVRLTEDGWQIDLLASFGGPFASALESLVERTADPDVVEVIRGEVSSIEAAYRRQVELGTSDRVRTALKSLLDALGG
jgi:ABC-type Fe3+-hydroxamate transport system substrate-binding protein